MLTVIVPATDRDLTTLDIVKEELDIGDDSMDAMLSRWIIESSAKIEALTNRQFAQEQLAQTFRYDIQRADMTYNLNPLRLARYPVVTVASVIDDTTSVALDPSEYEVDLDRGFIYRINDAGWRCEWWYAYLGLTVNYTAGYVLPAGVPYPLQEACLTLIKHRLAARTRDPLLRQQNVPGVLEQAWWVPSGTEAAIPPEVAVLIDPFREMTT